LDVALNKGARSVLGAQSACKRMAVSHAFCWAPQADTSKESLHDFLFLPDDLSLESVARLPAMHTHDDAICSLLVLEARVVRVRPDQPMGTSKSMDGTRSSRASTAHLFLLHRQQVTTDVTTHRALATASTD